MSDQPAACVPAWASIFNRTRFDCFMTLVRERLERSGERFTFGDGFVDVEREIGTATLGLGNLLQICHRAPVDDWPALIDEHFTALLRIGTPGSTMPGDELLAEPLRARRALRLRLLPASQIAGMAQVASREDLPGVITTLVLDLRNDIRALTWDDCRRFVDPPARLFEIALDNVRLKHPPQHLHVDESAPLRFLCSGHGDYYAATHALLLARHPGHLGRFGAIVGVPSRHMVAVHAIEDERVVQAIHRLTPFVQQCYRDGPGSITPVLYWHHDGRFERFDASARDRLRERVTGATGG